MFAEENIWQSLSVTLNGDTTQCSSGLLFHFPRISLLHPKATVVHSPANHPPKTKRKKKSPLAACQRSRLTHLSFKRKNRFPQAAGGESLNLATSQMDVFEAKR